MEPYLADTAFAAISNELNVAYDELKEKRKRAEDFAQELRKSVGEGKQKEARKQFAENRQTLKQYLAPKAFSDLEKTIMTSPKRAVKKE
jgi:DNA-binding TFAR19-related protein (PDSD5 family)